MRVERVLPTPEAAELLELVADIARESLAPRAALAEREGSFPRDAFVKLGASGLLGLPYPEEHGGAAQPYEVYLQVIEELSRAWLTVGLGISVHTLSCFPLARFGTAAQRTRWLPDMLGGALLGMQNAVLAFALASLAAVVITRVRSGHSRRPDALGRRGRERRIVRCRQWLRSPARSWGCDGRSWDCPCFG